MVDVPIIAATITGKINCVLQGFERRKVVPIGLLIDARRCTHQFLEQPICLMRLLYPRYSRNADAVLPSVGRFHDRSLGPSQGIPVSDDGIQLRGSEGAVPSRKWF